MTEKRPIRTIASLEELVEAIARLTPDERRRLYRQGNVLALGSEYSGGKELLNEAVKRALIGTSGDRQEGERGRPWPRDVDLVAFLMECMRSVANASQNSVKQSADRQAPALANEDGEIVPDPREGRRSHPSVEQELIERQEQEVRQKAAEEDVAAVRRLFRAGDVVHDILDGEAMDMSAEEVREATGMTATEYASARKRLRRTVDKYMPGRRLK